MDENSNSNPFDEDGNDSKWSNAPIAMDESPAFSTMEEEESSGKTVRLILLISGIAGCCVVAILAYMFFQPATPPLIAKLFPSPTATATRTPMPTATITSTPTQSPTPTITPTPHVLIKPPQGETVFEERFDDNNREWYPFYEDTSVVIKEGALTFRSTSKGYIGVVFCTACPNFHDAFYFQAEVFSVEDTPEEYGLAFCSSGYGVDYYVFLIDAQDKSFSVYKHSTTGWDELAYQFSDTIQRHPVSNILGALFNQGKINLYINNIPVFTYTDDNPFNCRKSGFIVNEGLVDVSVDNIFAYNILPESTPTP